MPGKVVERTEEIGGHVAAILKLLGWTVEKDKELAGTPECVAEFYLDFLGGIEWERPPEVALLEDAGKAEDMVVVQGLEFHSMCAHHLLPFFGQAHLGYVPDGRIIGLGSLARLVDYFSRRPQLQERMTQQVASHVMEVLRPRGVIVVLEARQLCMEMRGPRRRALVDTTAARGCFGGAEWKGEFFSRLRGHSTT